MITCKAPAKINLNLLITGRREDGLHLIDSLAAFAGLEDVLTLTPADQDAFSCQGPFASALAGVSADDNLIMRVCQRFRDETGWQQPLKISLEKNIPVAAGIGGGSADAAAMLWGMNMLAGTLLAAPEQAQIGLELGADIPVCLKAHGEDLHHAQVSSSLVCWRMQGVGEKLSPVVFSYPEADETEQQGIAPGLVLINTGVHVATAEVFKTRAQHDMPFDPPPIYPDAPTSEALDKLMAFGNSLEAAAEMICPDLSEGARIIQHLAANTGARYAGMSGSGATFFAVYDNADAARDAVGSQPPPCWHWAGGFSVRPTGL